MKPILKAENVTIHYNLDGKNFKALDEVNFTIFQGESIAIVGESGSGKTTLGKAICRLNSENAMLDKKSQFIYKGVDLAKLTDSELHRYRGKEISIIFQDPLTCLNPTMKIGEQILECYLLHNKKTSRENSKKKVYELLNWLGIERAEERYHMYPHEFSGGMLQRVLIAIAIALNPKILIADEPTSALDPTIQIQILNLLKKIQKHLGLTIILITHDLAIAASFTDKTIVMYSGSIVEIGNSSKLFSNPKHPYTKKLVGSIPKLNTSKELQLNPIQGKSLPSFKESEGCSFFSRCDFPLKICETKKPTLSVGEVACFQMNAENLSNTTTEKKPHSLQVNTYKTPLIEDQKFIASIKGVSFDYLRKGKKHNILNDINLNIPEGKILGLVGMSGSGKTTLCHILLNLIEPKKGNIVFFDPSLKSYRNRKIQMVFQDPTSSLNPRMTIEEIVKEPLKIYGIGTESERSEKCKHTLGLVHLDDSFLNRYPHELSGGQKQRVSIARALVSDPKFLILDEPTASLDVSTQAQIVNLLKNLQKKLKLTFLFISHDLCLMKYFSDFVAVLNEGKIIEFNESNEAFENPKTPYFKSLIEALPDQSSGLQIQTRHFTEANIFSVIGPKD
jgi:peptide/nickel transport system ATP-binding protein